MEDGVDPVVSAKIDKKNWILLLTFQVEIFNPICNIIFVQKAKRFNLIFVNLMGQGLQISGNSFWKWISKFSPNIL